MALTINGTVGIATNTDTGKIKIGASDDIQIFNDGSVNRFLLDGETYFNNKANSECFIITKTNGAVELYHDGSKKLETISTGVNVTGGIRLGGNNAANECDDYEEGTWTPRLGGSNISTYNVTGVGHYTKVGRMVFCVLRFSNTDLDNNSSGTVRIDQLPFTPSAGGVSPEPYSIFGNFLTHEGVFDETRKDGFEISSGGTMVGIQQVNGGAWIAKSVS